MSKEDKQRILATNRLLEILRAERDSDDVESSENVILESDLFVEEKDEELENDSTLEPIEFSETTPESAGNSDVLNEEHSEGPGYISAPEPGKKSEPLPQDNDDFSLLFTDEDNGVDQESLADVDGETVVESDEPIENEDQLYEEPKGQKETEIDSDKTNVDPEVAKLAASLTTPESKSDPTAFHSEEIKNDLLLKTAIPKDLDESNSTDIILPPEFNDNLITFYEENIEKPNLKKRLKYLKRYFSDNKRKITIYVDSNSIYLLQTLSALQETEVEMVKSFSLPYEYGNQMITGISDLLTHIFENEINPKDKKLSFGAYISMDTPSKTIIIKSPKLKKKEFEELVEWNANKNLPFSTDNKSVNWNIAQSSSGGDTQEVIIGVTETDSVNNIDSIFKRNNINLRLTSTLSILLWKSFVKNYPDKEIGSYVIVHIGESRTLVIVVTDHVLQFSRKIALGAQDFYKAIIKKVETNESGESIDIATAKDVLIKFGYPQNQTGLAANSNIDLNKVTIAIRPVVERINSELNRTLNYFKNQKSDLDWKELLFDGVATSFPGVLEAIQENIYQNVELLNPMRTGEYYIHEGVDIPHQQYPNYVLNFALASDEVEDFNVAPKYIRENYKYSFFSKVTAALLALFIPIFLFTGLYSSSTLKRGQREIDMKKAELQRLSVDTKNYASFMGDIQVINLSNRTLRNDRIYTENQIKILQLFSTIVPDELKLTSINFVNGMGLPDSVLTTDNFKEYLEITGFVNEDKSIADIYLTDFILQLEKMQYFTSVDVINKSENNVNDYKGLFFNLHLDLKK
jgi:Tfp pilus assembly PilM family ATPase